MQEDTTRKKPYQISKKIVIYDLRPTSFVGKALAFAFGLLLVVVTFFFSVAIFSILLTAVLFILIYAWWISHRSAKKDKTIVIENYKNNNGTL